MKDRIIVSILGFLAGVLLRLIHLTIRWSFEGNKEKLFYLLDNKPTIFSFWHSEQLCTPAIWRILGRKPKITGYVLSSKHRDGRIGAAAIKMFGLKDIPGSSTRGGKQAIISLVTKLKTSHAIMTPDGPTGPPKKIKFGTIRIAQLSGANILPLSVQVSSSWTFNSWDKMELPKPFSKGLIVIGDEIEIPKKLSTEEWNEKIKTVEDSMLSLSDRAGAIKK